MTEVILFLHVLAAFMLAGTVVLSSAVALGAAVPVRTVRLSNLLWDVGGGGTLLFGIWLAFDEYDILDGWIIAALVLWVVVAGLGRRARDELVPWHWARSFVVLLILVDMVWKPGA